MFLLIAVAVAAGLVFQVTSRHSGQPRTRGNRTVVPALVGQPAVVAYGLVTANGLCTGRVQGEVTSSMPVGSILKQHPDAGALVPQLSRVDLVVATSPNGAPLSDGAVAAVRPTCPRSRPSVSALGQGT